MTYAVFQRKRKIKCDSMHPCRCCRKANRECTYTPSRRGYQGPRRTTPTVIPPIANFDIRPASPGVGRPRLDRADIDRLEHEFSINPKPDYGSKWNLAKTMGVELTRINVSLSRSKAS